MRRIQPRMEFAVGTVGTDSQRIVTMVNRVADKKVPPCRLEVVSLDGQIVHDSLDIFDGDAKLGNPVFHGNNMYFQTLRLANNRNANEFNSLKGRFHSGKRQQNALDNCIAVIEQ